MTAATDPILAELERVLASQGFKGSPQLSRFLRYVVENGMPGTVTQLKESVIGMAVFNRGSAYDPKTDPVVRVEARRLRSRLDAYYESVGTSDPVRISLPKGGYVPAFEWIEPLPTAEPPRKIRSRWPTVALAVLAIAIAAYFLRPRSNEVSRFWSTILQGDRPALLIPADSALVMLQNLAKKPVGLQQYMSGEYREQLSSLPGADHDLLYNLSGRRYTSIADLEFASRLAHRPESMKPGLLTRYARDVRVDDLKQRNVIALGARMSNPWVELLEKDATFRLDDDSDTGAMRIVNLAPQLGEPKEIAMSPERMKDEIYGIITYHRNREGGGIGMVVAGMTVAGTEAAADFLLDDTRLLPWLRKAAPNGDLRGFDILLQGRNLAGSAPRAEVVSIHVEK